nr:MAG TPA: hypothetical protein [Caudoviricetes sp.]
MFYSVWENYIAFFFGNTILFYTFAKYSFFERMWKKVQLNQ